MTAFAVIGLLFGDEGKGGTVDYLTRRENAVAVVRFNGGAQCAHNVATDDGRWHTFSQFGSGTFIPGVKTFLSRHMMVNPGRLLNEAAHLATVGVPDALRLLLIDEDALLTAPYHETANRLREYARGQQRHGSTGSGVGETMADSLAYRNEVLRVGDLRDKDVLGDKLRWLALHKREQLKEITKRLATNDDPSVQRELALLYDDSLIGSCVDIWGGIAQHIEIVRASILGDLLAEGTVIFEGAQGVLLDQDYGFHPNTTWSKTTLVNVHELLAEIDNPVNLRTVGVLRAYATRHGAGPFVSEDPSLALLLRDERNPFNPWAGSLRFGVFDTVAIDYALRAVRLSNKKAAGISPEFGVDEIALTCLDQIQDIENWAICDGYRYQGSLTDLHPYFEQDADVIRQIIPPHDLGSHSHTEAIATRLRDCQPLNRTIDFSHEAYPDWFRQRFDLPITIASFGLSHSDRREFASVS